MLPSQVLGIIRIGRTMWPSGILGHIADGLVSLRGSTINSPWVRSVISQYPFWYDLRCCQDVKLKQATNYVCMKVGRYTYLYATRHHLYIYLTTKELNLVLDIPYIWQAIYDNTHNTLSIESRVDSRCKCLELWKGNDSRNYSRPTDCHMAGLYWYSFSHISTDERSPLFRGFPQSCSIQHSQCRPITCYTSQRCMGDNTVTIM